PPESEGRRHADPDTVENYPGWPLGSLPWRGGQPPLVSFSRSAGLAEEQGGLGSKVAVLKALGGDAKLPHFAMLTQGFPRLVTVSRDTLVADADDGGALPHGVQARVLINGDAVLIPDIGVVEASLHEALAA